MAPAELRRGMLEGKQVSLAGRFASVTKAEMAKLVESCGGRITQSPTRQTDYLIVGQEGWPLRPDGSMSGNLRRALQLQSQGRSLAILPEEELYERLGLHDRHADVHRLFTTAELARILDVPRDRVRLWVRTGLIVPVDTLHRLHRFDFAQVTGAKTIVELTRAGVSPARIRDSLQRMRSRLPATGVSLDQLALVERDRRLFLRTDDGALADADGQLYFSFVDVEESGEPDAAIVSFRQEPSSAEDWFEAGAQAEDAGRLSDAADAYRRALLIGGPDADVAFNLANVLHACGQLKPAAERYQQVVEIDPSHAEAWNNLGNTLSELGESLAGIRAFERAIDCASGYADAHCNLAETLFELERVAEAREHWLACLRHQPRGAWADYVCRRLADCARVDGSG